MDELPFIKDPSAFMRQIVRLKSFRVKAKKQGKRTYRLSRQQREEILSKTDGRCHFCGGSIALEHFEADHVKSHVMEGGSTIDNFLPSCRTCNNYRWHYSPEELKWILKMGVWMRNQIEKDTKTGKIVAAEFVKHEIRRERRRRNPRLVY